MNKYIYLFLVIFGLLSNETKAGDTKMILKLEFVVEFKIDSIQLEVISYFFQLTIITATLEFIIIFY